MVAIYIYQYTSIQAYNAKNGLQNKGSSMHPWKSSTQVPARTVLAKDSFSNLISRGRFKCLMVGRVLHILSGMDQAKKVMAGIDFGYMEHIGMSMVQVPITHIYSFRSPVMEWNRQHWNILKWMVGSPSDYILYVFLTPRCLIPVYKYVGDMTHEPRAWTETTLIIAS